MSIDPTTLPYRPCVGIMLVNRAGLIFTAQRRDQFVEAWQMPQGGIDPGEDPFPAALRELEEEISVTPRDVTLIAEHPDWLPYDLPIELVSKVWKGRYRGQTQKWFALRFLGEDSAIDLNTAHPEFSTWRWAPIDTLCDMIVPFKRDQYAMLVDYFRPLLAAA
jgi:putative (di)nucleoside polyphosphate hydrolase